MDLVDTCWVDISLPAFRANVRNAKRNLAGDAELMIAVKANAYGHGLAALAPIALEEGATQLAVLDIDTGVVARQNAPNAPLLCWLLSPHDDFGKAFEDSIDLGISHLWQLEKLDEASHGRTASVHLKIDTGLHRNGSLESDWPALVERSLELQDRGVIEVVGIWSHLADTSITDDRHSLERFNRAVDYAKRAGLTPRLLHIAASSAAADLPESRLDMVRIGIIVYGVSPFSDRLAEDVGFQPVMSVKASVVSIDDEKQTASLGIGFTHGLLPLPRNTGFVLIDGSAVPIVSVEADETVVSTATYQPAVGQQAVLFGRPDLGSARAEDWAEWGRTIGDEVVAGISPRVPRRYLSD